MSKISIDFNGENTVNLKTLALSLNSTLNCLNTIVKSDKSIVDSNFIVKDIRKGSIIIDIEPAIKMTVAILPTVISVSKVFIDLFKLRKHLGGKTPKTITNINITKNYIVENANNVVQNFDAVPLELYADNPELEKNLSEISKVLNLDDTRSGLDIVLSNKSNEIIETVNYTEEDIKKTKNSIDVSKLSTVRTSISSVWLRIKKLYFQGNAQWEFILLFNGTTIKAHIIDSIFLQKIQNGDLKVSSGTQLFVKLESKTLESLSGNILGAKELRVIEVIDIKDPESFKQLDMYQDAV